MHTITCADCAHCPARARRLRERVFTCPETSQARHLDVPRTCAEFQRPIIDLTAHRAERIAHHTEA